jgi:hypothetical protein
MNIVVVWGLVNLALAIYSYLRVKASPKKCEFIIWWAFATGAFVWEDMLVFGVLHFGYSLAAFLLNDVRIAILFFDIFWIVRSAGEILYQFLEQFIVPKHHPHDIDLEFRIFRRFLGDISAQKCFILAQTMLQVVMVMSIVGLVGLLMNWTSIPRW